MILFMPLIAECIGLGGSGTGSVPRVAYSMPHDGSLVDASGSKSIIFEWHQVPMPSSGRDSFRFVLRRASGYDTIVDEVLDPRVFSIEVSADKLDDGAMYRWYVKQRDGRTLIWSEYDIWYFTVTKK